MLDLIISEILDLLAKAPTHWSSRENPQLQYFRKDDNIFSLASSLFILQEIEPWLSVKAKENVAKITPLIQKKYKLYKNKDDRDTYNFYQTVPSKHFPNGYLMQYLDHFRLPDDIDDTALIFATSSKSKEDVEKLKSLTADFAESKTDQTIYNTWYGKSMPKEQDVSTILNLFYLFYSFQLPLNKIDTDSFHFLQAKIAEIESKPFEISRHYAHPALIVYHYARFMYKFSSPLDDKKELLIDIAHRVLKNEKVFMNKLLLHTSLIKFGQTTEPLDMSNLDFKDFYTFIGAPLAPFSGKITKKASSWPITQMFWKSEIHNKALVAEYLVLCKHFV